MPNFPGRVHREVFAMNYAPDAVQKVRDERRRLDRLLADHRHARHTAQEERSARAEAWQRLADDRDAQRALQEVAEQTQRAAHARLAAVVTRCLKAVFGDQAYEFVIRFEQKRGKTEARFAFLRGGLEVDPVDAAGGGVVDVAAFALRFAALLLGAPRRRKLLVLDEPFRFLSREYRPAVKALITTLAEEFGVQLLVVTHDPELFDGKVVRL